MIDGKDCLCRELYEMDQTSAESVKAAMDRVALNYGRIDVLYLNAGMHLALVTVLMAAAFPVITDAKNNQLPFALASTLLVVGQFCL